MRNLFKLIMKNFKLLLRSRTSALIVIFGPLLVIFLAGIAFDNTNAYSINIGVYSEAYSADTESFIEKLNQQEFSVVKAESESLCIDEIKKGKLHTCIIFPPNLDVKNVGQNSEIVYHVDYSKINLVYMVMDTLTEKFAARSTEISEDLTGSILNKLESAKASIGDQAESFETLENENTKQKTESDSIKGKLSGLDFSVDSDALSLSSAQEQASSAKTSAGDLDTYVGSRLTSAANNVKIALNNAGANGSTLYNALNSLDEQINESANKTGEIHTITTDNLDLILLTIASAESELSSVKSKMDTAASARTDINAKLDALGVSRDLSKQNIDTIKVALDKIKSDINTVPVVSAERIVNPITTRIVPVSAKRTHLNYVFPSLIVLVIMFISILLASTLVMMEKHSPAHFRNFITPVRNVTFVASLFITTILLVSIQLSVILGISAYFFKAQVLANLLNISLMMLLLSTVFTALGMFIGYIFTSEDTGTLASISLGSIFLFLSDLILPLESMPRYVVEIAKFNPFVIGQDLLRKTIIFGSGLDSIVDPISVLLLYSGVLLLAIFLFQAFGRQNYFARWAYKRRRAREARELETESDEKKLDKKEKKPPKKNGKKKSFFFGEIHTDKEHPGAFVKYIKR